VRGGDSILALLNGRDGDLSYSSGGSLDRFDGATIRQARNSCHAAVAFLLPENAVINFRGGSISAEPVARPNGQGRQAFESDVRATSLSALDLLRFGGGMDIDGAPSALSGDQRFNGCCNCATSDFDCGIAVAELRGGDGRAGAGGKGGSATESPRTSSPGRGRPSAST
jgi:hypothetical protein